MVSPGSARILHVQSALFSYSEGKWGLDIDPVVPLNVPPHDPSAAQNSTKCINYQAKVKLVKLHHIEIHIHFQVSYPMTFVVIHE